MSNRKRNVEFLKPEEPDFIKKLKASVGLTDGPNIETKNESLPNADNKDLEDKDEEQPVIVVLKSGDLSEEEVKQFKQTLKSKEEEIDLENNKIVFKKPDKNQTENKKNQMIQSSHKLKDDSNNKQKTESNDIKSVRNSSLLSFDDEEEEDLSD